MLATKCTANTQDFYNLRPIWCNSRTLFLLLILQRRYPRRQFALRFANKEWTFPQHAYAFWPRQLLDFVAMRGLVNSHWSGACFCSLLSHEIFKYRGKAYMLANTDDAKNARASPFPQRTRWTNQCSGWRPSTE